MFLKLFWIKIYLFRNTLLSYLVFVILTAIKEKRNAAFLRPSTASSVYSDNPSLWGTQYATDGLHSFYRNTQIFVSQLETSPWIMVTLDGPLLISFVRVYNGGDCCGNLCLLFFLFCIFISFFFHLYSLSCYLFVEKKNYKLLKKWKNE